MIYESKGSNQDHSLSQADRNRMEQAGTGSVSAGSHPCCCSPCDSFRSPESEDNEHEDDRGAGDGTDNGTGTANMLDSARPPARL